MCAVISVEWDKRHTNGQQRRCFQLFRATPTDSEYWSSEPDSEEFTVNCQSKLQEIVENKSLLASGVTFDILQCWKDDHLKTSDYSL